MLRRAALVPVALAVWACGGSPTGPAPLPAFQLAAGAYSLSISISHTTVVSPIGFTSSLLVCAGNGPTGFAINVDVAREGNQWIARPASGTLRIRLTEVTGGVRGTIEGSAANNGVTVTINDGQPAPAVLPETGFNGIGVGGPIDGAVRFDSAQGSQSCSSNAWAIYQRR